MSSVAISAGAVAASSSATISASISDQAKRDACVQTMQSYQHEGSTVAQMQAYADCIDLLHPVHNEIYRKIVVAYLLVAFLVGVVYGGFKGVKEYIKDRKHGGYTNVLFVFAESVFHGGVSILLSLVLAGVVTAIAFLFS